MTALLTDLPREVALSLDTLLPGLRQCDAIAGRFNLERLKAEAVRAPAVRVSLLDLAQKTGWAGPHHGFEASMAAFVITTDHMGELPRDQAAANMAALIAAHIADRHWEIAACGEAQDVRAQPIVNAGMEKSKASLWAVTWMQPVVLEPLPGAEPADLTLYLGTAPDIGSDHAGDYEPVGDAPLPGLSPMRTAAWPT